MFNELKNDFSFSSLSAGMLANLVGYSSSAVIVFQAAMKFGISPIEASTWLGVLCFFMGLLMITLSYRYKTPIMFAWSTAGAALILSSPADLTINEAVGAFIFSGLLIFLSGITGIFEKVFKKIPLSLPQAMLAGVLLKFVLNVFKTMQHQFSFVALLTLLYVFLRRISPRLSILIIAILGIPLAYLFHLINFSDFNIIFPTPVFHAPTFNFSTIISLGLPLFIVTMSSQNMAGIATLHSHHFNIPISKVITWSGFINILIAPFGGFAINLAAITAAICMGPEAHLEHSKRYTAAIASGVIYIFMGLFCGLLGSFFTVLPKELIITITGLALLGTVTQGLISATSNNQEKEAAMITFFVTASDLSLFGIGSAFFGILAGTISYIILNYKKK
jgi:benzoate membrane transport protein